MTRLFGWYQKFDLVILTMVFDLIVKNFKFGYNFWMLSTRTLIFHMSVYSDKTFLWVPTDLTL
jgi:hypothetical protein